MINVTSTFLPNKNEYYSKIDELWENKWVTNNGKFVIQLESEIKQYLNINNFLLCNNGTIVLQMAIKALGLKGKIITTPFSYVATLNSILWENIEPVFVDINENDCCINVDLIESKLDADVTGILATHVYGLPCNIYAIDTLATKNNLKVIYDGAHAFGVKIDEKSLLSFGDIATCSFHATKIFHTIEGGGLFTSSKELYNKLYLYRQFGHVYDDYQSVGINAKISEFHAAMGLCVLPEIDNIISYRHKVFEMYDNMLSNLDVRMPSTNLNVNKNYAYYPIIFSSETQLLKTKKNLEDNNIFTRRYFYPSLNTLKFVNYQNCPVSESISKRVLCLPIYYDISFEEVNRICKIIEKSF